jgi:hypothetical protein
MKVMPLLLVAIASWAVCAETPASTQPTSQPAALKTLESAQGGFKFDYPDSWKLSAAGSLKTIPKSAAEVETEFDAVVQPSLAGEQNDASVDALVRATKEGDKDKIDSDSHILLDGAPAREIVLTETDKIFETKAIMILTIRNGKQYKIVYSGPPDSFQMHRAEVDAIIKSWKWTDSAK